MINVAVIGAGHWGPHLIRNFHNHQQSRVAYVADFDTRRLDEVKQRFPEVNVTTDADEAIRSTGVDAVVIATPTSTHYPLAKLALENGKHVFVEKPIATNVGHGDELCDLAAKAGTVLLVGHLFVYNAGVQRVRQYIDDGMLGRVYYISMVRTNLGPIRMDVNAAWDLASHDISIANYWLRSEPVTASAVGGTWINDGLEDAVFATLRYPDNVLVNLHVSWLNPRKVRDITVVGDHRMAVLDDMNIQEPLRVYDKGVSEDRVTPKFTDTFASFRASVREGDITIPKVVLGEPLKAECDHFIECIAFSKDPLTGGRAGVSVVRALEAIERSARAGGAEEEIH